MKYPDKKMSLQSGLGASSVRCWLGRELESRGIDAVVYTRYIISLLLQDPLEAVTFDLASLWFAAPDSVSPHSRRARHRKSERKKCERSAEDCNKVAAVECLRSISDEDCGIESLVDELCERLRDVTNHSDTPPLIESSSSCPTPVTASLVSAHHDPFQRYYAEFPALHGLDSAPSLSPTVKESTDIWNKNPITCPAHPSQSVSTGMAIPASSRRGVNQDGCKDKNIRNTKNVLAVSLDDKIIRKQSRARNFERNFGNNRGISKESNRKNNFDKTKEKTIDRMFQNERNLMRILHGDGRGGESCYVKGDDGVRSSERIARTQAKGQVSGVDNQCVLKKKQENMIKTSAPQTSFASESQLWQHKSIPCYEEQASWYTQPVLPFALFDSFQNRLYKRHSFSDSQEDSTALESPPVEAQRDEGLIFGLPQFDDDIFGDRNVEKDVNLIFHGAREECSNEPHKCKPDITESGQRDSILNSDIEVIIKDYNKAKSVDINPVAESMVNVCDDPVERLDEKTPDAETLTTPYESILESVKNLDAEYQMRNLDGSNLLGLDKQSSVEAPIGGCEHLIYGILSSYSSALLPDYTETDANLQKRVDMVIKPPTSSSGSVDNLPFMTPDGIANLWNDHYSTGESYSDTLNRPIFCDWNFSESDEHDEFMRGVRYLWDTAPIHKGFELIVSEHSAFDDVIHPKIHHVHSDPNMCMNREDFSLNTPSAPNKDGSTGNEHLYFSPKTHFCPINAAEDTAVNEAKVSASNTRQPQDLFGGYKPTESPYQEYRDTPQVSVFVPRFRVQNNSEKFVQTGESLDLDSPSCKCDESENCSADDKLDDKIDYVIAILDDEPGQDADTGSSFATMTTRINTYAGGDMRSLWVSADDPSATNDSSVDALSLGNIWSSGYDDDTMFLFGNYDEVSGNDPGYFSEHVDGGEQMACPELDDDAQADMKNQQAFNWSLFAPLPSHAIYSSDLEEHWLQTDLDSVRRCSSNDKPASLSGQAKPCTYFMEGKCRRTDCKYSHDLGSITCRFWLDGVCFKGANCPFMHDLPTAEALSADEGGSDIKPPHTQQSLHPSQEEDAGVSTGVSKSQHKQAPRRFYMFKRNPSQASTLATNRPSTKSPHKSVPLKTRDNG